MEIGGRKPTDPDYGVGEHAIDGDRLGLLDENALTERLIQTFESPGYRPPRLPAVATQLLALSQNPDVEFAEIETLLEKDAMLAGEVLTVARSAFYSGARPAGSLREALVRLGLSRLREVVLQAALTLRVFRSAAYRSSVERLQQHCRAVAHLARIVARHTTVAEEQAFLCGLLHDVGIAGILLSLGEVERGKQPPDLLALWPSIDAAHGRAGARMVALWGLPPAVALAVDAHHQVVIGGRGNALAATVCLAEMLAVELDRGLVPTGNSRPITNAPDLEALVTHGRVDRCDDVTLTRARETLSVSDSTMESIRTAAQEWSRETSPACAT